MKFEEWIEGTHLKHLSKNGIEAMRDCWNIAYEQGKLSQPLEADVLKKNADTNNIVYQFAGKVARVMKHLSSSHVYFILQTAFSNEDRWEEVDEILKQVISQTNVEWEEPKY